MGIVNKGYISTKNYLDKREILNGLLDVYNEEPNIVDFLELTGRAKQTDREEYVAHINDWLFDSVGISAVSATLSEQGDAAGEPIVVTVTGTVPRIGELAQFDENKGIIGRVTAISGSDVTISPVDTSADGILNPGANTITTAGKIMFFSGAYGEGSGAPASKRPKYRVTKNNIQIFKEAVTITDVQKVAKVEVTVGGDDTVVYKSQHDALMRHRAKMAGAFIEGFKATGTDADGNKIWYTQGLRNYITSGDGDTLTTGGYELALAGAKITKANFRTLDRTLDKQGAPSKYLALLGGDLHADVHELVHDNASIKNGGINYNSWGSGTGKNKKVDLGLSSVNFYGRDYDLMKLGMYDNQQLYDAGAFDFNAEGYAIPLDKIKVEGGGATQDRLSMRYMPVNGDIYHEFIGGRLAPKPTSDEGLLKVSYHTIAGIEALGINHFGLISA